MIFDLDGTLVQTERLKGLSYARAVAELRPEVPQADALAVFARVVGRAREEVARALVAELDLDAAARRGAPALGLRQPWQVVAALHARAYEAMLEDPGLVRRSVLAHNVALVEHARRAGFPLALGSMSCRAHVDRVLGLLGLDGVFGVIATRDDVVRGKPDPEIYLLLARELGRTPHECLAIEDSAAGVTAALTAGVACLAVPTSLTRPGLHAVARLDPRWLVEEPAAVAPAFDRLVATLSA
ncbi:MAG TPA: HAD family phosphatase [Polyangia bacterium]